MRSGNKISVQYLVTEIVSIIMHIHGSVETAPIISLFLIISYGWLKTIDLCYIYSTSFTITQNELYANKFDFYNCLLL